MTIAYTAGLAKFAYKGMGAHLSIDLEVVIRKSIRDNLSCCRHPIKTSGVFDGRDGAESKRPSACQQIASLE